MNKLLTSGVLAALYGIMAIVASVVVNEKIVNSELEEKPINKKITVGVSSPESKDNGPK